MVIPHVTRCWRGSKVKGTKIICQDRMYKYVFEFYLQISIICITYFVANLLFSDTLLVDNENFTYKHHFINI